MNHRSFSRPFILGGFFLVILIILLAPGAVSSNDGRERLPQSAEGPVSMPGFSRLIRLDPVPKDVYVAPPPAFLESQRSPEARARLATSTIIVNYLGGGWTSEAQAAFQYAADIWETLIESPVPIIVNAQFGPLGTGILGGAGPTLIYANYLNAPQANTWYPIALANKLAGSDLDPSTADINATFSSTYSSWYFGDGTTPVDKINFTTVVLHELGHGLGFLGSMRVDDGSGNAECSGIAGRGCYGYGTQVYPMIYDRFTENGAGSSLLSFPNNSTTLASQLTSNNIYFDGPKANVANGGGRTPLYAPNPWMQGSSYSHLAESYNNSADALMTFSISKGETVYSPGPVTLGIMEDTGWSTVAPPLPPPIGNGNFEQGHVAWSEVSTHFPGNLIVDEDTLIANSQTIRSLGGGQWLAWLGGENDEISVLSQDITMPDDETYLHFWYALGSAENTCDASTADGAFVIIEHNGGENITDSFPLCIANNTMGYWVEKVVDLSAYAGQDVTLIFKVTNDSDQNSNYFLDKISLEWYPLLPEKVYAPSVTRN